MNRCKDCKHFGEETVEYSRTAQDVVGTGFFTCGFVKHACRASGDLFTWPTSVAVSDSDDYNARLLVRGDFGCVNFELGV